MGIKYSNRSLTIVYGFLVVGSFLPSPSVRDLLIQNLSMREEK